MYKPYSDSYLMTKSKKTLIEYLRVAEHNHRVCEEIIDQQVKNYMEVLKKGRADTVDECIDTVKGLCSGWRYGIVKAIIDKLEELKEQEE